MFYIRNKITQQPIYPMMRGKVEKAYLMRSVAEREAQELPPPFQSSRIDVVEISLSSRLKLENMIRREAQRVTLTHQEQQEELSPLPL